MHRIGILGGAGRAQGGYDAGESDYGDCDFRDRQKRVGGVDAQRVVTYFGYKFNEQWLLNSEIEIEHGTTADSSGSTDSDGSQIRALIGAHFDALKWSPGSNPDWKTFSTDFLSGKTGRHKARPIGQVRVILELVGHAAMRAQPAAKEKAPARAGASQHGR